MFRSNFAAELFTRVGSNAEIATDSSLIEGVILKVSSELVIVEENSGYGPENVYIALNFINFVRFS
ncbi:hypothetical protein [Virgibacillus chiguensis]|uniref:Uncharacterized protein n=1 Tax=Virgibacillus chiguensis TaxID=411959 RepID=A0A1M5QAQ7_9BACI|nr:hypothetical protein [Virgibacillus chiguensis]SHH10901.1 hypothetical protein SAMN05421807_10439 [Virgibacillus chiguensis]